VQTLCHFELRDTLLLAESPNKQLFQWSGACASDFFSGQDMPKPRKTTLSLTGLRFSVDPSAPLGRAVKEVCFKARETGESWSSPTPADSRDRDCYEYYVALFVFAVLTRRFLETKVPGELKPPPDPEQEAFFEIPATNALYGLLVKRLHSVWRESRRETNASYRSIPPELVQAASAVFDVRASEAKRGLEYLHLHIPTWVTKDIFLFRPSGHGPSTETGAMNHGRGRAEAAENLAAEAELTTEDLLGIAERERLALLTPGWLTLYRQTALLESPRRGVVDIQGDRVRRTEIPHPAPFPTTAQSSLSAAFEPEVRSVEQMVEAHRRVLLTAPSGGGKSTLLNALFSRQLSDPEFLLKDPGKVLFSVRLKDLKHPDDASRVAQWVGMSVRKLLEQWRDTLDMNDLRTACPSLPALPGGRKAVDRMTREEIFEEIGKAAVRWFNSEECARAEILFLLDGYNEVRRELRRHVHDGIQSAIEAKCALLLTTRSYDSPSRLTALPEFRLRQLSDEQIVWYLEQWFPKSGEAIFKARVRCHHRVLSMVRNPFFLNLTANWIRLNPTHSIPHRRAHLIEWFVQKCAYRKREADKLDILDIDDRVKDCALGRLAYVILRKATSGVDQDLSRYPQEVGDQFVEGYPLHDILDVAEAEGLIRKSGAQGVGVSADFEFVHDYFLYFFAAKYLVSVASTGQLARTLADYLEYPEWDIPLALCLELNDDQRSNTELLRRMWGFDDYLALLCAVNAQIPNETVEEFLVKSGPEDEPRGSYNLIPTELSTGRMPVKSVLLARLSEERAEELAHKEPSLLYNVIMNIPSVHGAGALDYLKRLYGTASPGWRPFILESCGQIQSIESLAFVLQCFDRDAKGMESFHWLGVVYDIVQPLAMSASDLWGHALSPDREVLLGHALSWLCRCGDGDITLVRQLLCHANRDVAKDAAIMLIQLKGNEALSEVGPVLRRVREAPYSDSYSMVRAIAELHTPEAETFLFQEMNDSPPTKQFHPGFSFVAKLLQNKEALAGLLRRALSIPNVLKYAISETTETEFVCETLDTIEQWPRPEEVKRCLTEEFSSWENRHRLLVACLHKEEHRKVVIETIRTAASKNWYVDTIETLKKELEGKDKEANFQDRLSGVISKAAAGQDLRSVLHKEFQAEDALDEAQQRRGELVLAARAARVLRLSEVSDELRSLANGADKSGPIYLEAFRAWAALSDIGQMKALLQELREVPYSVPGRDDFLKAVLNEFLENLNDNQLPEALKALYNEHLDLLIEKEYRPNKRTYVVHAIQRAVKRLPSDEPLVEIIVDKAAGGYRTFRQKGYEHMWAGFLFLIGSIQEASGRRFLKVLRPAKGSHS
jgi:hypothetical protein